MWIDSGCRRLPRSCPGCVTAAPLRRSVTAVRGGPSEETLEARLAALISFYRWQAVVHEVPVAGRLLKGAARRAPARGLLSYLDARCAPAASSVVRVRRHRAP